MQQVSREAAMTLLCRYNQSDSLIRHGIMVEGVMRYFAAQTGQDVEYWGTVGLLHDLDYEQFPDMHCAKTAILLEENGYGQDFIHAVVSHGYGVCTDVEPVLDMEKVLFTVDELTGLVAACVYMRPNKSVMDLELKSVKKKYKSKGFAAGVNREIIEKGAAMMGMGLDEIIEKTIQGLRSCAREAGLYGDYQED